jgi:tRNA(Ile)-lysidine synthase
MHQQSKSHELSTSIATQFDPTKTYWLGFSGGLDSHVLLHILVQLKLKLHAIYIDHGLSPNAKVWAKHCAHICLELDVPFSAIAVNANPAAGQSPEQAARAARYRAFADLMQPGDYLLTAHHQDDQAETLLLQMLRGAGLKGMASMPACKVFARGFLQRPLLPYSRSQLLAYAKLHALQWIEDESNLNLSFDRNYLRHRIMPLLQQRWPAASASLARSAKHAAEGDELLSWFSQRELEPASSQELDIRFLFGLPEAAQKQLLRTWIAQQGLKMPGEVWLSHLLSEVIYSKEDAKAKMSLDNFQLRRYRNVLYMLPLQETQTVDLSLDWAWEQKLELPHGLGILQARLCQGQGIKAQALVAKKLNVRFRQGGERCQPQGRIGSHPLKKLWQEWNVPSWQRAHIPLLYLDEQLAAVVGYCVCEPFAVSDAAAEGYMVYLQAKAC